MTLGQRRTALNFILMGRFSVFSKRAIVLYAVGLVAIFIVTLMMNPFSVNESGYREHVRTFNGAEFIRFEPGFYYAGFFAEVTPYPDVITVQYGNPSERGEDVTYFAEPHNVRFNGGDNALIGHTVKWDLPDDETNMLGIHRHYRSHDRLASTTLSQYQRETAGYATQMLDSETHYSGGQSQLKEFFQDQLRNGQILLDKETKVITDDLTGKTETVIRVEPRVGPEGQVLRTPSDIQKYELSPSFVSIDYIQYDDLIENKLKAKIESATIKSISEQKLITAQQEALTAIEEGKKQIEEVKARKEAEKLEAVIMAQQQKEVAEQEAIQAKYIADKIAEEGRAQAEANRALVAAGLTPEQRMKMEIEIADRVSANLAKLQFPDMMVIGGGSDGQPLDPFQAVGLESFLKIQQGLVGKK